MAVLSLLLHILHYGDTLWRHLSIRLRFTFITFCITIFLVDLNTCSVIFRSMGMMWIHIINEQQHQHQLHPPWKYSIYCRYLLQYCFGRRSVTKSIPTHNISQFDCIDYLLLWYFVYLYVSDALLFCVCVAYEVSLFKYGSIWISSNSVIISVVIIDILYYTRPNGCILVLKACMKCAMLSVKLY